jgi:hypothetical protein
MAKAVGQESPSGVPRAGVFDPQSLTQANQAFAKLWSSAIEISQTISRNMQAGESQNPVVAQLLGNIFDPRAWFSGTEGMDQALQQMAEGPRLADVWDTERKMLTLFNAWTALRRRSLEHNTVMLEAWLQRRQVRKDLNERQITEALGSSREVLLWVDTANSTLLETHARSIS